MNATDRWLSAISMYQVYVRPLNGPLSVQAASKCKRQWYSTTSRHSALSPSFLGFPSIGAQCNTPPNYSKKKKKER